MPRRALDVDCRELLDEAVVYSLSRLRALSLNRSGRAIWDLCDGQRTVLELTRELGERLRCTGPAPESVLLGDIRTALSQLEQLGFVAVERTARPDGCSDQHAIDNGFASVPAMSAAYQPIVDLALLAIRPSHARVAALPCGNAALLRELCDARPEVVPIGVDSDPSRIREAREVLPAFAGNFACQDMFEAEEVWAGGPLALAIVPVAVLAGASAERATRFKQRLRTSTDAVLVYDSDITGLRDGARECGLTLLGPDIGEVFSASFATLE